MFPYKKKNCGIVHSTDQAASVDRLPLPSSGTPGISVSEAVAAAWGTSCTLSSIEKANVGMSTSGVTPTPDVSPASHEVAAEPNGSSAAAASGAEAAVAGTESGSVEPAPSGPFWNHTRPFGKMMVRNVGQWWCHCFAISASPGSRSLLSSVSVLVVGVDDEEPVDDDDAIAARAGAGVGIGREGAAMKVIY